MYKRLKTIAFLVVLILLCNMIIPTITVFANTTRKIQITSDGMYSRVVFTDNPDDDNQRIEEFFVDPENSVDTQSNNTRYLNQIYVYIEPNFFEGGRITSIKINGESKTITAPTGRNTYMISAPTATTSSDIKIEVTGIAETHYNIMWANPGANVEGTDFDNPEVLLENGFAKITKVFDNENDMNDITNTIEHIDEGCVDPEGKGFVSLTPGNVVVFEFEPEYGYQLTSVTANGRNLEPQDEINQYMFIMPDTNIHFQATFTKIDNTVTSKTSKIKNGSILLGQNEILAGTAQLDIKDANLTDEHKDKFNKNANDYSISNIFDIKLNQIFYKGSNNSNDVWTVPLGNENELNTPVEITLALTEDLNGNDVILLHEKDNGDYEIINTEYNKENNTIKFKTSSFSNYAIATKTVNDSNIINKSLNNPPTGDSIFTQFMFLVVSIGGIVVLMKVKNNK